MTLVILLVTAHHVRKMRRLRRAREQEEEEQQRAQEAAAAGVRSRAPQCSHKPLKRGCTRGPASRHFSHSLAPPTCDAEIAVLQLRHVWIPPIVVNPDASMALAHSSAVWHHEGAATADPKQHGAGACCPCG